jgi:uncharacterized protein YuzE
LPAVGVRSGRYSFPWVTYDPPSDILHARLSRAPEASRERSPEGDIWSFDEHGRPTGVTVIEPRARLDRDGAVYITLPSGERERLQGIEAEMRPLV